VVSSATPSVTALRASKQCVIAVPGVALAPLVVKIGNCSGRDTEKFTKFGLTPVPAAQVEAPLITQCLANLECRVTDTKLVNKYNMFILEVVKAWVDPTQKDRRTIHHQGYGKFAVDGEVLTLPSKMR
jgi:flavin reductase (DIM6/NTAB) family NADH-FMN oxidoreductase RutF